MPSFDPKYLKSLSYSARDVSTLRELGEFRGKQELFSRQRPEVLESLRQVAMVESAESSNRLEGITAPQGRLEAIVQKTTTPRDRSEQEIAGYRDALEVVHQSRKDMPFSVGVVRQLHQIIHSYLPGTGGAWKTADNEIVEKNEDGRVTSVRFTPVSAVATPQAMEDLVAGYRAAIHGGQEEPLVVIPLTVLDFLCVHPFTDGNGRVGRLLALLLLYHFEYEVGRYISLERIVEESKETYYEALHTSSQAWHDSVHDARPWLSYFWGVLLRAYREFEERAGRIGGGRGAKSEQVRRAVLRKVMPFSISDLERDCPGVSRDTIRIILRQLRDEGVVLAEGRGRGARWSRVEDGS
jgi:Fic family protein